MADGLRSTVPLIATLLLVLGDDVSRQCGVVVDDGFAWPSWMRVSRVGSHTALTAVKPQETKQTHWRTKPATSPHATTAKTCLPGHVLAASEQPGSHVRSRRGEVVSQKKKKKELE